MKEKLKVLLAQGNLDEAINQLLRLTQKTTYYNDIILLSARLNQTNKEKILGIIDPSYEGVQKARLAHTFLAMLEQIDWERIAQGNQNPVKTILFLAANPVNTQRLKLDTEVSEIEEELRSATDRDKFNLEQQWATTVDRLRRALLRFNPHFVHFSGHGETTGIVLEDDNKNSYVLPPQVLAHLLSFFSSVQCVILNACYSEPQAQSIVRHIPYVIGMDAAIPDRSAIEFAAGFYSAIGHGRNIEDSFYLGKLAVASHGLREDMIVLLKKA